MTATSMWEVGQLRYDPETHTTSAPDGSDVPHVTAVLTAVGLTTDFEELASYGGRRAAQIESARDRGQAVHADCHAYDDEDLDIEQCHPVVRPYVEAWARLRRDTGLLPVCRERQVYHPLLGYTGFLDGVFALERLATSRILVDIKTGDPEDAAAHLQTAAYAEAWPWCNGSEERIDERWAVWLLPGERVPYRIYNYTAMDDHWLDFPKFQAALTVYSEQPGRRARRR